MTDTISITGSVVLDERAAVQSDDNDLAWSTFSSQLSASLYNSLFTGSGALPTNTGGTFPQVAYASGYIGVATPVDDLMLVSDGAGTPYPSTGLATTLTTTAGDAISLFGGSGGNVVYGKTAAGAVAFAVILDETLNGDGDVSAAKLYLVQFAPLSHPLYNSVATDPTVVDSADTVNLHNLVYLASATTSSVTFKDFSQVPSGQDNWTIIQPTTGGSPTGDPDILVTGLLSTDKVNVSTTGLGTNSQAIDHNEGLRFDFVNGGAGGPGPSPAALTNPQVHDDTLIAYSSHQLGSGAGFSLTQVNPGNTNTTITVRVAAFNATGDDQGAAFKANLSAQTAVNITSNSLVVHDAANNLVVSGVTWDYAGDELVIGGLKNGYHVDFLTDAPMDRMTVQNTTSQTNRAFDIGNVTLKVSTTSGENHEIGTGLVIEDDGPSFAGTIANQAVAFSHTASVTASAGANLGADGGALTIASYSVPTGLTAQQTSDLQHITYYDSANQPIYQFDLSGGSYTFAVLQDAPSPFSPLDFSGIPPGSPNETLTVPTIPASSVNVTFDGVLYSGTGALGAALAFNNPGTGSTNDDLNANSLGFGEKLGQASQMNQNEGFFATAGDDVLNGLAFDIQGIGGVKTVNVEYWLVDDGVVVEHDVDPWTLPSGSAYVHEVIQASTAFDEVYVRFYYDTKLDTSGVRVLNFASSTPNDVPDRTLQFQLQATDGDFDTVVSNIYSIHVDPSLI